MDWLTMEIAAIEIVYHNRKRTAQRFHEYSYTKVVSVLLGNEYQTLAWGRGLR